MPPFTGYGAYSGVAGALDGLSSFLRGRKEDQERERQWKRQEALDADAAIQRKVAMALTKAQLNAAGIREGSMPAGSSFMVPGLTEGAMTQVQDPTRYTDLGGGFYQDRNATPEFKKEQQGRVAATTAANLDEQKQRLIGQALQSANPREALAQLMQSGMSASDASKVIETMNPAEKAPVYGSDAWKAAKSWELEQGDKYDARRQGRSAAMAASGKPENGMGYTGSAAQRAESLLAVQNALGQYRNMFAKTGTALFSGGDKERAALDSQYGAVQMALKEAFNLGVLNGPDLELLEKQLTRPTGLGSQWKGKDAMIAQIDQTMQSMAARQDAMRQVYGGGRAPSPAPTPVGPVAGGDTAKTTPVRVESPRRAQIRAEAKAEGYTDAEIDAFIQQRRIP